MAWTSRIIYIEKDTAVILEPKDRYKYTVIGKKVILNKITDTHTEKIIIYECEQSKQQHIW